MTKLVIFALVSIVFIYISRASLRVPGSHGFYRFFAWEFILALFLLNVELWFRNPFSWYQLFSWFLLIASLPPLVFGIHALITRGKPIQHRDGEAHLIAFEKTTNLVTTGLYRYIRHPLYSSLLLLAWGVFFKRPSWLGSLIALAATLALIATSKADEAECMRFFGPSYEKYMMQTKRFVPFLF